MEVSNEQTRNCKTCLKDKNISEFRWATTNHKYRLRQCKKCDSIKRYSTRKVKERKPRAFAALSEDDQQKLLECLSQPGTVNLTSEKCGINRHTLTNWMSRGLVPRQVRRIPKYKKE